MKILYIITGLGIGGAENLLVDICGMLKDENDITVAYLLTDLNFFVTPLEEMGVKTVAVKSGNVISCIFKLRKIINSGFDIVHTHLFRADFMGRIAAMICGRKVKIFSTIHNTDQWRSKKTSLFALVRWFDRATVNRCGNIKLIAVSDSVKQYSIKYEKFNPDKITVITNVIDPDNKTKYDADFSVSDYRGDSEFVMVSVARLEYQKNHINMLEAVNELVNVRKADGIKLNILGEGSLRKNLEEYIAEHGLEKYVSLMGVKRNVYDYLKASDLFVSASLFEGFPLCVLEAIYCDVPILINDIDIHREVCYFDGILFRTNDFMDMADKIEKFRTKEYNKEELLKKAEYLKEKYSIKTYKKKIEKCYGIK